MKTAQTDSKPRAAAASVTAGEEQVRSARPKVAALASPDALVREQLDGFVKFLRERAIVGLAVGFVIAMQVQGLVKQLIASFLDPFSKLLFGSKLSVQTLTVHLNGRSAEFAWGAFVYALIDFLVVIVTIYAIIKIFKLDKLVEKPKDKK